MEEVCKENDDLRAEVEALTAQLRVKSDLADGLKRAGADQAARLREARAEAERHARDAAARGEEAAAGGERCGQLEAKLADKEQALRHLRAAHDALKATLRERSEGLEAEKRELLAALEDSEARRQDQETALRARDDEVARLRGLLSEKQRKCSDAEQRALAPREVMMRDDMLGKLEEEKAAVEGKLKWKAEQFRHLEEALKKVQDDFKAAKREWGSDRSTLVDRMCALEADLDSKTRVAEDFRWRFEMCSQALAREEGRRKPLEAEMSELRNMYGNVVSEYEEARSTIESLGAKRDGEIASLRSSLAEKVTLLKEMGYSKAHLEQENEDLRSSQIGGADAVVSLKGLLEKFRDLEQTHRNCALADSKSELSQLEIKLHQQNQAIEHLEKLKVDMETELKGYMDDNCILKRDLDAALAAKMEAEELLTEEKVKLLGALDEANCALSERNSELNQLEINFHQQKQALEHLEKLKVDIETEIKIYMDENNVLKRDLDAVVIAKMEAEKSPTEEKEKLCGIINEKGRIIDELQQHIAILEEENLGQKLDLGSLIRLEHEKSIQEVNNRYSEIVEVFDKKLLELEKRLSFFEQKFTCREQEIMEMFDREEADWYTLIASKEIAIADIQQIVESVQLDIKQLLEAAAAKVTEVQLKVKQLYGFAETLNSLYTIQEHDSVFKGMVIAEYETQLESLQVNLVLEKEQSGNLRNLIQQLKSDTTAEMLEKAEEHLKVTNKLKSLEARKEILEEQLGELKSRTTDLSNVVLQERSELIDELNGLTNNIGEVIHGGEDLMSNLRRIMQKVNDEEHCNDMPSSEKINVRSSAPLSLKKSGHLPDIRSPLKEHNF